MQRTYSVASVLGLQDTPRIGGDLILLPHVRLPNMSESYVMQKGGVINVETSLIARNQLSWDLLDRQTRYSREVMEGGREPEWVARLPLHVQRWLRHFYATQELDPLSIVGNLPNSGLCYMVEEGGLCEEAMRVLNLWRLQQVNQLGFLQAPWVSMTNQSFVGKLTHTTRWVHSLDVMCIGSVIAHNLGLEGRELNTQRLALFSHDRGTPAGGDSVKLIDLVAFDEDANYERLLHERTDRKAWQDLKAKWDIDEKELLQAILNKGLMGQVLDIADKLAYVARDIETCMNVFVSEGDEDVYIGMKALDELRREHRDLCGVWDAVRRDADDPVFADAGRLIAFLKARIVLFRELYYHPRARFGEYLISRVLVKRLYDDGILTRDQLLEMGDGELETHLQQAYGGHNILRSLSLKSQMRSFATREEAATFKRELEQGGETFSLMENHLNAIKPGTHFLVDCPGGPKPLSEAYPGDAQELWEMANMLPGVHVYYLAGKDGETADLEDLLAKTANALTK